MNKCEILSKQYPNTVILQLRGGFYNAFDDSAIVLSNIMDYKLNQSVSGKYKSGFPVNILDKVIKEFKKHHIDTIVFNNEKIVDNIIFDDNEFVNHVDRDLFFNASYSSKETSEDIRNVDNANKSSRLEKSELSDNIDFLTAICNGRNPYTNEITDKLDLNNVNTINTLYKIRDVLIDVEKEGDYDG